MRLEVETGSGTDVVDVTEEVRGAVGEFEASRGICQVSARHTTAAVAIQENEPGVVRDLEEMLEELVPEGAGYHHDRNRADGNAHSHLRATLLGNGVTFPVREGEPVLGTWQSVMLLELDGPRTRTVDVEVVG